MAILPASVSERLDNLFKRADQLIERTFAKVMPYVRSPWRLLMYIFINEMICAFLYSIFEKKGIVASFWWTLVTVFTVGYGDMYPATLPGRFVGGIVMISGWLFLSLLLGHILTAFLPDPNVFTDEEQEFIKNGIAELVERAKKTVCLLYVVNGKLTKLLIWARVIKSLQAAIIYRLRKIKVDLQEIKHNQTVIIENQKLLLEHFGITPWQSLQASKTDAAAITKD